MILRHIISQSLPSNMLSLLLLLSTTVFVMAADFDCHVATGGMNWDLTPLKSTQTLTRTRESPPTTMVDELRFKLCKDLKSMKGVPDDEQCESGTRACLRTTNKKTSLDDRVIAVIPIASTSILEPEYAKLDSPKGLSLTFHGSPYPSSSEDSQSIKFSLLCADAAEEPKFVSYENGTAHVEWSTPSACGSQDGESPQEDDEDTPADGGGGDSDEKPTQSVGSGLGFFFLVLILAFAAYLVLGAYYNYSTYGARGVDLIPHRDFWREVPYMLQDVVSHLCSTVRPRQTNRGGYIAV